MKEELQTALADLISKTLKGVDAGKDFLTAEMPDVLEQLLMWHGWYSFIEFVFGFILIIVICIFIKQLFKNANNIDWTSSEFTPDCFKFIVRICIVLLSLFIVPFYINLTWLQIWIAPKVWLIEYMGKLVK